MSTTIQENKPAEKTILKDSHNAELLVGDRVEIKAVVTDVEDEKNVSLVLHEGTDHEVHFSVPASDVKKLLSIRIGAAPQQRIRTIEVPHPLGGVVPVPEHSPEAVKHYENLRAQGKAKVEGLPNTSPAVQDLEAKDSGKPSPSQEGQTATLP